MTTSFPPFLSNSDVSSSTVTSPAVISIKPTLTDLTSAFKPFDFFGGRAANVDNLAALNNWVAYGGPVLIPAGRFAVSATPNTLTNQSAAMVGLGDGASMFVFAGGGLSFSQDSFAHVTHVRDLSLLTTSIDVGTALTYADAAADIVAQRFQHRVSIQRVGIRGDTITTQGWAKGLSMTDPQCALLDTLTITGRNNSTTENTRAGYGHMTSGIEIIGTAEIATDIDLRHPRMNNCQNGILVSGHIEGLRLSGGLLVNVWAGVNVNMASLRPGYNIDGTHINFFDFGVKLANVAQAKITNCLMYKHPVSTAASVAISLSGGCSIIAIESNQCINETPDFATGGAWTFASLTNSDFCLIQDNEIERPSAVTVFGTGTTNTRAWNNTALGTLSGTAFAQHTDSSGNGTNTADAVGFPVSFTGPISVSGSATFTQPVLGSWNGALNIGQFYATPVSGRSAVFGSDGALGYLTDASSAGAPFSAHRPLAWNLATGDLSIAADGASTTVGGRVTLASGLGVFGRSPPTTKPTISGSRGGNAALGSLLTALGATGLILDGTAAGLVGDGVTDNTAAFNAALAIGDVLIPPGSYRFASQPNAITVARSIIGAGRTATTLLVDYAAGDFFRIGDGAGSVPSYATVQGMVIASNVIRSSGAAIHVFPAHHAVIRDIAIAPGGVGGTLKHFNGIQVDGGANQFGCHIEDFEISSTQGFGIGFRSFPQDIYIRDGVIGFAGGAGIDIQNGSGLYFSQIDVISSGFGISCEPGAGDVIDAVFCDTVLGDSSTADNWRFWGTGKITNVHLTTCWSSNSLGGVGFSFKNPNINGITLGNSTCHGSWLHGVHVVQGKNITIDGCQIGMNSRVGNTGWNEIQIDPNVSHVIVTGNTIGHVGAYEANGAAAYTAFGVYIAAGTGDYISVIGNKIDIGFDATGQCLATGSNIVIRDNVGWKTTYSGVFRVATGTQSVTFPHNLTVTDPNKIIATVSAAVNPSAAGAFFFWVVQPTVGIGGTVTVWTDVVVSHDFWFSFRISAFE